MPRRWLNAVVVLPFLFAGCASDPTSTEPPSTELDTKTYTVTVAGTPSSVRPGDTFDVKVTVGGNAVERTSSMVRAAFWSIGDGTTRDDTPRTYECGRQERVPLPGGPYAFTCTAPSEVGLYSFGGQAFFRDEAGRSWHWEDRQALTVRVEN